MRRVGVAGFTDRPILITGLPCSQRNVEGPILNLGNKVYLEQIPAKKKSNG